MFARVRKNRPVGYVCGLYFKNGIKSCTSHYIKEKDLEKIVLDELMKLFKDGAVLDKAKNLLEKNLSREGDLINHFLKLEQQIVSKQRQQDVLYMDKLEGKISDQLFLRMNMNIENRISQLRHEIEKEKLKNQQQMDIDRLVQYAIKEVNEKGLTNEIIKMLVKRIAIFDESDDYKKNEVTDLINKEEKKEQKKGAVIIEFNYSSP